MWAIAAALSVNIAFAAALLVLPPATATKPAVTKQQLVFVALALPQVAELAPAPKRLSPKPPVALPPVLSFASPGNGAVSMPTLVQPDNTSPAVTDGRDLLADYIDRVSAALAAVKRYPWTARRARHEGTVMLRLILERSGQVAAWRIEKSANVAVLDAEAGDMVRRAAPFPAFPKELHRETLDIVVPIAFSLRG